MQLKSILSRVQKFKSFVCGNICWVEGVSGPTLEVELHPRRDSRPVCAVCGQRQPGYDKLTRRQFEFITLWGIKVFFLYAPRRVDCPACGVRVEQMPWAADKHQLTESYACFLAGWAKRLIDRTGCSSLKNMQAVHFVPMIGVALYLIQM